MGFPTLKGPFRRLRDAFVVLPVVGAVLVFVPLLWQPTPVDQSQVSTSTALIYLFSIWIVLIAGAAVLSVALRRAMNRSDDD